MTRGTLIVWYCRNIGCCDYTCSTCMCKLENSLELGNNLDVSTNPSVELELATEVSRFPERRMWFGRAVT
jgi:hypothetical protein